MTCETCSKLQKELYEARLTISRNEKTLNLLKQSMGMSEEKITYDFLDRVCRESFTYNVLKGGPKTYASYVTKKVMPGRVVVNRKNVRYVSDYGNVVEESVVDFVDKVLESTRVRANQLYNEGKESIVNEFCTDSEASPTEMAVAFANMAKIRNCNQDFCRDVASIIIKNN